MKVVCVSGNWKPYIDSDHKTHTEPIEDNIYTVVDSKMLEGFPCYLLKEIPAIQNGARHWWQASKFVPLDSYKEKELKEELSEIFL